MNIKTNYKEVRNEEKHGIELYFTGIPTVTERTELKNNGFKWHGVKKCWYKSENYLKNKKEETKELKTLKKLTSEEVEEIAKKLWDTEKMQEFIIDKYDFYKTNDGLIIELEKVNKISITKTLWYDDEQEDPGKSEANFLIYNRYNTPGRNLEAYLEEKENLQKNGCASGRYDYNGIYFTQQYYSNDKISNNIVSCNWFDEKDDRFFIRYLTEDETNDFIQLEKERKEQYIERLKKYYKRYGQKYVRTKGYWVNR